MKQICIVLLGFLAAWAVPATAQQLVCKADPDLLDRVSAQAAAQVRSLQSRHGERQVASRTQAVFARLVDTLDPAQRIDSHWELLGYGSEVLNAHAMQSGAVLVSLGLDAPDLPEDLLAAALAHEIAHVVMGHALTQACFASQFAQLSVPLREGEPMPEIWSSGLQPSAPVRVLMRAHELEADAKAVELLHRAGYFDHAMSRLLELLAARSRAVARPAAVGSHPDARLRIVKAREAELALVGVTLSSVGRTGAPAELPTDLPTQSIR